VLESPDPDTLGETSGAGEGTAVRPGRALDRGDAVGRYVVLGRVGSGGMGVVYAAYDPELDRKVALKLLKAWGSGDGTRGHRRLLREAQAMARLSHPNVITVHDVGEHRGSVFVAMEFVEGRTLGAWLAERTRPVREVLDVMLRAGQGLSAAHAAGLVHRDFKPDNVMVGDDGRVRVMDFGLARSARAGPEAPPDTEVAPRRDAVAVDLTREGAIVGTPAYMAPEQHLGLTTDARTDQFCFCVALYEALYGERPFPGESAAALALAVSSGEIRAAPARSRVDPRLRRILRRGLAADPAHRWPNMDALLAELGHDAAALRRRALGASVVAVGIGALAWALASRPDARMCEGGREQLSGTWDPQVRERVGDALLRTGLPYARATWERVEADVEAWVDGWATMHREACEASRRGEASDAMLDRRMACLDQRRAALAALVGVLEDADVAVVDQAVQAALALPTLERCADADALLAELPPPEDEVTAQQVTGLRERLEEVSALENAGRYAAGLERARAIAREAEAVGFAPLLAEARFSQGALEERVGNFADAEALLRSAYHTAVRTRHDRTAAQAALQLVFVSGVRLGRLEDARSWSEHADSLVRRVYGDDDGATQAHLANHLGAALANAGELEAARQQHERGLQMMEQALGVEHPDVALQLNNLGTTLNRLGRFSEAVVVHERSAAIWRVVVGPEHPQVATTLTNLGAARAGLGDHESARRDHEAALRIFEAAGRGAELHTAEILGNLGNSLAALGDHAAARRHHERALEILRASLDPHDPTLANELNNLGAVLSAQGDAEGARAHYEEALSIAEALHGPEHPMVAVTVDNLGGVLFSLGRPAEALARHDRALAVFEAKLGAEHPYVGYALTGRGKALVALGRPADAVEPLTRALAIREESALSPGDAPESRFWLARALFESGRDRHRGLELARRARDEYAAIGGAPTAKAEVEAWLARRP
jgi:tetratricopeptide (TPR) repeat protein